MLELFKIILLTIIVTADAKKVRGKWSEIKACVSGQSWRDRLLRLILIASASAPGFYYGLELHKHLVSL
jgi:hypothetical protein